MQFRDAPQECRWSTSLRCGNLQDPEGKYVKQWVPEVGKLPKKYLHQPWLAPAEAQKSAGLVLGETYPHRITGNAAMQVLLFLGMTSFQGCIYNDSKSLGRFIYLLVLCLEFTVRYKLQSLHY